MDNAPWFDEPDLFDQGRIRLADIDGSGTTDILYLGRDGVRVYLNESGNGWSDPHAICGGFPPSICRRGHGRRCPRPRHRLPAMVLAPAGRCGNAAALCRPDVRRRSRTCSTQCQQPRRRDPHRLRVVDQFYLADKAAGTPWVTRLPFPVHVVERVETYDHVSRNRFVTATPIITASTTASSASSVASAWSTSSIPRSSPP